MKRVAVIGKCGSGKSTLARKLGEKYNLEVIHLDKLFHGPNWAHKYSKDEFFELVSKLVKKEKWVIDGNYRKSMDIRFQNADTIIFLDLPKIICSLRVINRLFDSKKEKRIDVPDDCEENLDLGFFRLFYEIFNYHRKEILEKINKYRNSKKIYFLKSQKEIDEFLGNLE